MKISKKKLQALKDRLSATEQEVTRHRTVKSLYLAYLEARVAELGDPNAALMDPELQAELTIPEQTQNFQVQMIGPTGDQVTAFEIAVGGGLMYPFSVVPYMEKIHGLIIIGPKPPDPEAPQSQINIEESLPVPDMSNLPNPGLIETAPGRGPKGWHRMGTSSEELPPAPSNKGLIWQAGQET
jgi:hypothetical protein